MKKLLVDTNLQHLQFLLEALHKTKTGKNSSMSSQSHKAVKVLDPWRKPTIALFLKQYIL